MKICADEIGVPLSELSDESSFADLGMDSLLSLTVAGKFREAFDIDVSSSLFVDYATVKELKGYLAQYDPGDNSLDESLSADPSTATESTSGNTTPVLEIDSQSSLDDEEETVEAKGGKQEMSTLIRSTIAEEMGVPAEEISATTDLAELGMDSLMSLQVLGKLRENTGEDLPSEFFAEHATFGDIEKTLNPVPTSSPKQPKTRRAQESPMKAKNPSATTGDHSKPEIKPLPRATSILMQGNPKNAFKTLFLFPDGSGSATSYAQIPSISSDLAVYGLNCPFMKSPEDYTVGIPGVSALYIDEVRRRQPHGPYTFGGWSAGGVCAYEAAVQMQAAHGETVDALVLLDAPCPIRLDPLPSRLHHFFDSIGLLGPEGNHPNGPPGWLLPHFDRSIANLSAYKPTAMDPATAPRTYAIWATDGICKNQDDPRPTWEDDDDENAAAAQDSVKWLLDNRTDLMYNRWDQLIPTEKFVHVQAVADVNHFTLMRKPGANEVGAFIKRALE